MKLIFLSFILSFSALANLNGQWSGIGSFYTDKNKGDCNDIFFDLVEDQDYFKIKTGGYTCEEMSAEYPFSKFKKSGKDLLYFGKKVGIITRDGVVLEYYDGIYKLILKVKDKKIDFSEEWKDGDDYLIISGKLNNL